MGTPSYMPPEQADGRGAAVGPKADVYAIGATLYALATGRPPFQSTTPMDTILQVIHQEPVPPWRLNAGIPRDLETICLNYLEKDPARRYATAEALVDELRRFLDGKPILTRPVGPHERAWRWSRRNRLAAALITVVARLTAAGTATITGLWLRAENLRQKAVSAEGRTRLALEQAVAAGERADRARGEAVAAGRRAEASAATARQAVNDYLDRITEAPQLKRPGLLGLRRDLLSLALGYYEGFLRKSAADPGLRAESAAAGQRVAMIPSELGDTRQSLEVARQAVALGEELVREHPDRIAYQHLLAASLNSLANPMRTERRLEDAADAYRRGIAVLEGLVKSNPQDIHAAEDLAMETSNLATVLGNLGRSEESVTLLTRNRARLEDLVGRTGTSRVRARSLLAGVLHSLGDHAADRGRFDEAAGLADEAAGLWPRHPGQLIRPALLLTACVGSSAGDSAEARARRDRFGRRAVELLTRAFDAGYRDPSFYRANRSLDPIRSRDDFQALLRRLDSPTGAPSK